MPCISLYFQKIKLLISGHNILSLFFFFFKECFHDSIVFNVPPTYVLKVNIINQNENTVVSLAIPCHHSNLILFVKIWWPANQLVKQPLLISTQLSFVGICYSESQPKKTFFFLKNEACSSIHIEFFSQATLKTQYF